jgi:hypothetical protein
MFKLVMRKEIYDSIGCGGFTVNTDVMVDGVSGN